MKIYRIRSNVDFSQLKKTINKYTSRELSLDKKQIELLNRISLANWQASASGAYLNEERTEKLMKLHNLQQHCHIKEISGV